MSLLEAGANTASGFCVSFLAGLLVYPAIGWQVTAGQNLVATACFTIISIGRSYAWRRLFNRRS